MDETSPTPASAPSHRPDGSFAPGNKLGRGNPLAKRQGELRRAFMDAATPLKIQAVAQSVYQAAVDGDMIAARLYLDYTVGRPKSVDDDDEKDAPALVEPPLPLPIAS